MSGFILYSMADLLPVIRRLLPTSPGFSVVEIGSEAGIMTRELAGMTATGQMSKLTVIEPWPGEVLIELSHQTGIEVFEGMSHDALPVVPLADVYLIDGDHNYFTVERETAILLERAETEGRQPLLLYHDVAWPWDRRDLYYAPERIPRDAIHPHEYHLGVTLETDELVPNGFRHYGGIAMAKKRGGERNGVRTAIEDVVARHPDWEFHVVPAIFGLGVLFSRKHPEYARLSEEMRIFADNPVIAMLERNRIDLFLRLQKMTDEEDRETIRSFPEPRVSRDFFLPPEGEQRLWNRLVTARETATALAETGGTSLLIDLEGVLAHPAPAGGMEFHAMLVQSLKEAGLLPDCISEADFKRLKKGASGRAADNAFKARGATVPTREEIYRELAAFLKDSHRAMEIEKELVYRRLQPDYEAIGLLEWVEDTGWTVTLRSTSLDADEAKEFAGRLGMAASIRHYLPAPGDADVEMRFDAHLTGGVAAAPITGTRRISWHGVVSFADGSMSTSFYDTAAFPYVEAVERVSAGVRKTVRNINPLLPEEVAAFAPVVSRFADWCVRQINAAGIHHSVCFGEDGAFTATLLSKVAEVKGHPLPVAVLPGGAKEFALASLGDTGREEIARYMEDGGGNLKQLMGMLGLGHADLDNPELAELKSNPTRLRMLEMLSSGPLASLVEERSASERLAIADRIGIEMLEADVVAVVGFRWGGLLVNALNRVAALEGWKCRFTGYFLDGRGERAWELLGFEACFESWLKRVGCDTPLFAPCWKTPEESNGNIDNRERLKEGLLDFQELWHAESGEVACGQYENA